MKTEIQYKIKLFINFCLNKLGGRYSQVVVGFMINTHCDDCILFRKELEKYKKRLDDYNKTNNIMFYSDGSAIGYYLDELNNYRKGLRNIKQSDLKTINLLYRLLKKL